eukprot:2252615-Karenia_brevis.AAC.1
MTRNTAHGAHAHPPSSHCLKSFALLRTLAPRAARPPASKIYTKCFCGHYGTPTIFMQSRPNSVG